VFELSDSGLEVVDALVRKNTVYVSGNQSPEMYQRIKVDLTLIKLLGLSPAL